MPKKGKRLRGREMNRSHQQNLLTDSKISEEDIAKKKGDQIAFLEQLLADQRKMTEDFEKLVSNFRARISIKNEQGH